MDPANDKFSFEAAKAGAKFVFDVLNSTSSFGQAGEVALAAVGDSHEVKAAFDRASLSIHFAAGVIGNCAWQAQQRALKGPAQ